MKVWILQTGEPLHIDSAGLRPMRAMNLSNALIEQGHQVVLWSSDFDHFSKKHRTGKTTAIQVSENLEIRLISSCGYKSHVGLSRLFDHAQLAFNLKKELKNQAPPNVAFVGYPPIETAWVMTNWLAKKKIPSLLDIKDSWPEVLRRAFPKKIQFLAQIALTPYYVIMKKTFQKSTGLSSISPPFLDWSLNQIRRKRNKNDQVIPLTVPKNSSSLADRKISENWWDERNVKLDQQFRACFIGSVSSGFNFQPIFIAAKETHIQIVIAGEGSRLESLKTESKALANISYPGWIDISKSEILFERSSIMIAPIIASEDFAMSIPNKFYDALKNGIPIISSIKGYGREVIESNNLGYCYDDATELISIIRELQNNRYLIDEISIAQKDYFNKHFEYEKIYGDLVQNLTDMVYD